MDRIGKGRALRPAIAVAAALAALALCAAAKVELPQHAPVPAARPQPPGAAPVPSPRPQTEAPASKMSEAPLPADVMPAEERACRERLRALGVAFEERERLSAPEAGCLVAYPVAVTALGPAISLAPEAVMNCAMAEAAARFAAGTISPEAERAFGSPLAAVAQASAYVCRNRHGQSKISEHALGNALDISALRLKDGTEIAVHAYGPEDLRRTDFIRTLRTKACGPFKTVLGPGSDADHALHLHLDLQQRRRGGTFCQ